MILTKLNTAIRNADKVWVQFKFGRVDLQKTSLLDALKNHYGRNEETGCTLKPDGQLTGEP